MQGNSPTRFVWRWLLSSSVRELVNVGAFALYQMPHRPVHSPQSKKSGRELHDDWEDLPRGVLNSSTRVLHSLTTDNVFSLRMDLGIGCVRGVPKAKIQAYFQTHSEPVYST